MVFGRAVVPQCKYAPLLLLLGFNVACSAIEGRSLLSETVNTRIPTLVLAGDHDFIPIEVAEHIARAIPNVELVTLKECGHFAYLGCYDDVHRAIDAFLRRTTLASR
jgi:pimeloyl-ACP methyl ester carboxylesterase